MIRESSWVYKLQTSLTWVVKYLRRGQREERMEEMIQRRKIAATEGEGRRGDVFMTSFSSYHYYTGIGKRGVK